MVATAPDAPCLEPLHWPVQLAQQLRLSPEQFELVCEANPDAVLELSADGHLITTTPTGSETSARTSTLVVLWAWPYEPAACRTDPCSARMHRWCISNAGRH